MSSNYSFGYTKSLLSLQTLRLPPVSHPQRRPPGYNVSTQGTTDSIITTRCARSVVPFKTLEARAYPSPRQYCDCTVVHSVQNRVNSITRRSLTRPVLLSLIVSLVMSQLDYGNATLAGSPSYMFDKLQSVLNAAARLIFSKRRLESVTPPLLRDLHWLRVPQRVEYKLSVLVYRCLHYLAPEYLCDELRRVDDISSRQRLRSSSTSALIVPPTRLSTVGDGAFPTAASRIWNSLPLHVTSAPSLQIFKKRLKPFLFSRSFPS